jgi:hypothetical protein
MVEFIEGRSRGRPDLLSSDPYLSIHVDVEPSHIIWSHGNALDWMEDETKQRDEGYTKEDIVEAYQHAMSFWNNFWALAFGKLGYPSIVNLAKATRCAHLDVR